MHGGEVEAEGDAPDDPVDDEPNPIYPPEDMLRYLKCFSYLKSSVHLREVLALAAVILNKDYEQAELLRDKKRSWVPCQTTLMRAHVKLDTCMIWWNRLMCARGERIVCSLQADSSEQHHVDYFMQRHDILAPPPTVNLVACANIDPARHFHRATLPICVVGHGEKGQAQKARALLHCARLLTGCEASLVEWRLCRQLDRLATYPLTHPPASPIAHMFNRSPAHPPTWPARPPTQLPAPRLSVRGMCTDQGSAERCLVDMPYVDDPERVSAALEEVARGGEHLTSDPFAFMFPRALWVSGPLHLLWNAFETSIKSSPRWDDTKEQLTAVLHFLGHKGLRQRYVEVCLGDQPADVRDLFKHWRLVARVWVWLRVRVVVGASVGGVCCGCECVVECWGEGAFM